MVDPSCFDCARAATVWHHGGYRSDCPGCKVRSVASAPKAIRRQFYERMDEADRPTFIAAVRAEISRVAELRMKDPA